jgi:hypothetical protein
MTDPTEDDDLGAWDEIPPHDGTSAQDEFSATMSWSWYFYHTEQLEALIGGESPRGAAVLCRGYLESALEELLLLHALNDFSARKPVGRALSYGLDEKISTCSKLKLIRDKTRDDAHRLRQVGDRFAHRPDVTGAQDEVVMKLLNEVSSKAVIKRVLGKASKTPVGLLQWALVSVLSQISDRVATERELWKSRSRKSES